MVGACFQPRLTRQPAESYGSYGSYGHTVIRRLNTAPPCRSIWETPSPPTADNAEQPDLLRSQPPAAPLAWNALKRTRFEKHKCHLCFRAVEIFDSLPTVYRKFRPSCAGLAIDRRHRSNQIESHPEKPWCGPGAGLVRAWCGPGAGLVRAWCGPGAVLVRAWCALACEGLLCQTHHPRITRITRTAGMPLQDRSRLGPRPKPRSRPRSDRSRGAGLALRNLLMAGVRTEWYSTALTAGIEPRAE